MISDEAALPICNRTAAGVGAMLASLPMATGAEIIACRACAEEYAESPPAQFAALAASWKNLGDGGTFFHEIMGSRFDWRRLVDTPPTTLFDNKLEVTVGNKSIVLNHLGSARTRGDILVHVPADGDTELTRGAREQVLGLHENVLRRTPAARWGVRTSRALLYSWQARHPISLPVRRFRSMAVIRSKDEPAR
jgi:hypothetical protein